MSLPPELPEQDAPPSEPAETSDAWSSSSSWGSSSGESDAAASGWWEEAGGDVATDGGGPTAETHPFGTDEFGRYDGATVLGRGGMGRVTSVLDQRLRRQVALKTVLPTRAGDPNIRKRLANEAWITAQLEHPSIVPVYDAGQTPDGEPYYVMRLIRGRSLQLAVGEATTLEARLRLLRHFLASCEAVAYAHARGIIHRDLKPSNIMVGEFGETQVVDWGLAKRVQSPSVRLASPEPGSGDASTTQMGAVVGTPQFMSPEQAIGSPADERSDVYGLGSVLYFMLTGRPPFEAESSDAAIERVKSEEVTPVAEVAGEVPRELAAIADRALQRDPEARYHSAKALAEDVERYLDGRQVGAYEYTPGELFRRFVGAYRVPLLVALGALVVIAIAVVVAYGRVVDERNRAVAAEESTATALTKADEALGRLVIGQAEVADQGDARPEAEILAARALGMTTDPRARGIMASMMVAPRVVLENKRDISECWRSHLSRDATYHVCWEKVGVSVRETATGEVLWRHKDTPVELTVLEDSKHVAARFDGQTFVSHLDHSGRWLREVTYLNRGPVDTGKMIIGRTNSVAIIDPDDGTTRQVGLCLSRLHVVVSRDERHILSFCSRTSIGVARDGVVSTATLNPPIPGGAIDAVLDESGGIGFVIDSVGALVAINTVTGETLEVARTDIGSGTGLALSPDESRFAIGGDQGGITLYDGAGRRLTRMPLIYGNAPVFAKDGSLYTVASDLGRWTLPKALPPRVMLRENGHGLTSARFSPDGQHISVTGAEGTAAILGRSRGDVEQRYNTLKVGVVKRSAYSPDGKQLAVAGSKIGEVLRIYDTGTGDRLRSLDIHSQRRIEWLADNRLAVVGYETYNMHFVDPVSGEKKTCKGPNIADISRSPDRRWLAGVEYEDGLWVMSVDDVCPSRRFSTPGATAVSLTNGATRFAVAYEERVLLYGADGTETAELSAPRAQLMDVAISPREDLIAAAGKNGLTYLWRIEDGDVVALLGGHTKRVVTAEFDTSGAALVTSSWDGTVRLWNMDSLEMDGDRLYKDAVNAYGITFESTIGIEGL